MAENGTLMDPGALHRRGRTRRKRFLGVSLAGLAVLAVALGVSFLGSTGSTSASVNGGGSTSYVFPVGSGGFGGGGPSAVTTLKYGSTSSAGTLPAWSPTLNAAGAVTTFGDLALIDPSGGNTTGAPSGVTLTAYITNLSSLQLDYSSFAFPFNVYKCASSCTSTGAWSQTTIVGSATYLTSTEGFLSFNLPAGNYYDIVMDNGSSAGAAATPGGSYFTVGTTAADLSPSFYFSAQPY